MQRKGRGHEPSRQRRGRDPAGHRHGRVAAALTVSGTLAHDAAACGCGGDRDPGAQAEAPRGEAEEAMMEHRPFVTITVRCEACQETETAEWVVSVPESLAPACAELAGVGGRASLRQGRMGA